MIRIVYELTIIEFAANNLFSPCCMVTDPWRLTVLKSKTKK
jgi:hypothetical protein